MNNAVTGIILMIIGGADIYFAVKRLNSFSGKFLAAFNRVDEITLVLLVSGVIILLVGMVKLFDRRR